MAQNQTQNQTLNWDSILKTGKIEIQHIDFAINNAEQAPVIPYEFVYSQFASASGVKISPPTTIAISGVGGVIGAILVLRHTGGVKYFITTKEVLDADEKSQLYLSRYALERLSKIYQSEVITLKLGEFETIKLLLQQGGIYISGLPYELVIQISQLAGFGKLWHYSPIHKKFFVF
ncbi:MAG: hypothetical protein RXN93_09320 [Thermocladium sp.]